MNWNTICDRITQTWKIIHRHPWANAFIIAFLLFIVGLWAVQHAPDQQLSASTRWVMFVALSAAILGLFRETIVRWISHPDFEVTYDNRPPFIDAPPLVHRETGKQVGKSYYFRLIVANRGSARAEKVEVVALDVQSKGNDFRHRYSMDLKWSHSGVTVLDGLSPAVEKYCDIGCVEMPLDACRQTTPPPRDLNPGWTPEFKLRVELEGTHRLHYLPPGVHELNIVVVAANHKPQRYKVTIVFDGQWSDNMEEMRRHVVISVVRHAGSMARILLAATYPKPPTPSASATLPDTP